MQRQLALLFETLNEDHVFFKRHLPSFVDNFTQSVLLKKPDVLSVAALNAFGSRLFNILFGFHDNPLPELFNFAKKALEHGLDIKPIVYHSLLDLIREYATYTLDHNKDISALKTLVELIELYLITIDEADAELMASLKEELHSAGDEQIRDQHDIIVYALRSIHANDEFIKLLTYVDELPVICRTKLGQCTDENIEIDITACFRSVFTEARPFYIKSDHFQKTITGTASLHPGNYNTLIFSQLHFVELPQESRRYIRTAVPESMTLTLFIDNTEHIMNIYDISVGGIGTISLKKLPSTEGRKVQLSFELMGETMMTNGSVRYVKTVDDAYHYGIEFESGDKNEEKISEFVTNRQFEILKLLKARSY